METSNPTQVTIYAKDNLGRFSQSVTYDVLGVTYSGSRGNEYRLGHKEEGLVHRVCSKPEFKVRSALASGQRIVYHY